MPDNAAQPAESTEAKRRALAAALLNAKALPAGYSAVRLLAAEAQAYHALTPYPWWHFNDWKTDDRGPYPRCMAFGKSIVVRSARWLFGKPIQINCTDNPELQQFLRDAWTQNRMRSRMRAAAEMGGQQGGVVLKFSYDGTAPTRKLRFQILSPIDNCKLYYDPHDRECLLMARVQYPYLDSVAGKWMMYREEWTDQTFIRYKPVEATFVPQFVGGTRYFEQVAVVDDGKIPPDLYGKWEEETSGTNPFGVIPLQPIRNIDIDDAFGTGDMWGLFRMWDNVNLTYNGMSTSNQFDSVPNVVYQDIDITPQEADKALAPGNPISLKSDEDQDGNPVKTGKAYLLEPSGKLRPAMMDYAKDLRQQVLVAASSVDVDPEDFTNKGNLTEAVLLQLFVPLIELTEEKRESYGQNGVCQFLEKVAIGLTNLTQGPTVGKIEEISGVKIDKEETFDVQIGWPNYFQLSQDEMAAVVARTQEEEAGGYVTHDRAIQRIAKLEQIDDIDALTKELAAEAIKKASDNLALVKASATATDPNAMPGAGGANGASAGGAGAAAVTAAQQQLTALRSIGGDDSK